MLLIMIVRVQLITNCKGAASLHPVLCHCEALFAEAIFLFQKKMITCQFIK